MKVQIVKIGKKDSYSGDEGFIGAAGTIPDVEYDFRSWYNGHISFNKPLKIVFNPEGRWAKINSAHFHSVRIKRVK